jgi:hypothetical protein
MVQCTFLGQPNLTKRPFFTNPYILLKGRQDSKYSTCTAANVQRDRRILEYHRRQGKMSSYNVTK